jgi:hypothetical protein
VVTDPPFDVPGAIGMPGRGMPLARGRIVRHQEICTMPHPTRRVPRPRRAEPLQPDRPTRGTDVERDTPPEQEDPDEREKRHEQTDAALDNVREGYR